MTPLSVTDTNKGASRQRATDCSDGEIPSNIITHTIKETGFIIGSRTSGFVGQEVIKINSFDCY